MKRNSTIRSENPTMISTTTLGSLFRVVALFLASWIVCEITYLTTASAGLWVQGIPLDYENWAGFFILSIIVIPQAHLLYYVLWSLLGRRLTPLDDKKESWAEAFAVGVSLGIAFWAAGGHVHWVVPWMPILFG